MLRIARAGVREPLNGKRSKVLLGQSLRHVCFYLAHLQWESYFFDEQIAEACLIKGLERSNAVRFGHQTAPGYLNSNRACSGASDSNLLDNRFRK